MINKSLKYIIEFAVRLSAVKVEFYVLINSQEDMRTGPQHCRESNSILYLKTLIYKSKQLFSFNE